MIKAAVDSTAADMSAVMFLGMSAQIKRRDGKDFVDVLDGILREDSALMALLQLISRSAEED